MLASVCVTSRSIDRYILILDKGLGALHLVRDGQAGRDGPYSGGLFPEKSH